MDIHSLTHDDVNKILPERKPDSHKGDYGKILLLCGSEGYSGAAAMAAMGALRSGAGLVYLGVPESIYMIEAVKLTEPVVFPLPDRGGKMSCEAVDMIMERLPSMDAVLIGPGCGQSEDVDHVVSFVLNHYSGPVILDADGINLVSKHYDILRGRCGTTILTPHCGEFTRLCGFYPHNRVEAAVRAANDLGSIILLKGHHSVITDGNTVYINETGNPGMAVGGSGDVLAGIITSLVGQGIEPLKAAACAAWLHGAAGDICAREIGQYGMLPTDIVQALPRLMK